MSLTARFIVLTAMLATAPVVHAQTAPEPARILMLYAYDPKASGIIAFADPLRAVVRRDVPGPVEFYEESLDLDRFDDAARMPLLARQFAERYRGFKPAAIVAAGSMALKFATEHLRPLFPDVPVVYGMAFDPVVDFGALPPNVTGRRQPLPFAGTLAMARGLQPDAERVVLVTGSSVRDSVVRSTAVSQITPLLGGMKLSVLQDWTYESLLDSLRQIPSRTIVILASFRRDQRGYEFSPSDIVSAVARASSAPLYGIAHNWTGSGILGGSVMHFADDGKRTGQLLVRVLRRAPGAPLPAPEVAATPFVVDWRQLERWGLPANRLPPDTEILFRTPTLWQRHWPMILGVLALLAAQSLLIWRLLLERNRRVRSQQAFQRQTEFERMMAGLTTDGVRVAHEQAPRALEDALTRIGRFAEATAAVLTVNTETHGTPIRLSWSAARGRQSSSRASSTTDPIPALSGSPLEIPLIADQTKYGVLELYNGEEWSDALVTRLKAAAALIANALARERANRNLERTRAQVAHMARVATVGELAAAVSHELRQPLAAIRANAEAGTLMLGQKKPEIEEARAIFRDIVRDNLRAAQVIDHIGMLVKRQETTSTAVDLNALCQNTTHLLDHDVRLRGARIKLSLDPQLHSVSGDPVQLQQLVMNLVLNALDASASSPRGCEITVGTAGNNGHAELFVQDSGPGLPPHMLDEAFEPFVSTKPHGLGMGLAIVRTIVEQHRGSVRAENAPAGGAVFRVAFPTINAPNARLRPADVRGRPATKVQ